MEKASGSTSLEWESDEILYPSNESRRIARPSFGPFLHFLFHFVCRHKVEEPWLAWDHWVDKAVTKWKTLGDDEKGPFIKAAENDAERYAAHVAKHGEPDYRWWWPKTEYMGSTKAEDEGLEEFSRDPVIRAQMMEHEQRVLAYHDFYFCRCFRGLWDAQSEEVKKKYRDRAEERLEARHTTDHPNKKTRVVPPEPQDKDDDKKEAKEGTAVEAAPPPLLLRTAVVQPQPPKSIDWASLKRWDTVPQFPQKAWAFFCSSFLTEEQRKTWSVAQQLQTCVDRWRSLPEEEREKFTAMEAKDMRQYQRQCAERTAWAQALAVPKDQMDASFRPEEHPAQTCFGEGQNRREVKGVQAQLGVEEGSAAYGLKTENYPVIRTDWTDDEKYAKLKNCLLKDQVERVNSDLEFEYFEYSFLDEDDAHRKAFQGRPSGEAFLDAFATIDGCDAEGKLRRVDLFGHPYCVIVDSRSMRDGTVDLCRVEVDENGDDSPNVCRLKMSKIYLPLCNLDIANMDWYEFFKPDRGEQDWSKREVCERYAWRHLIKAIFGTGAFIEAANEEKKEREAVVSRL